MKLQMIFTFFAANILAERNSVTLEDLIEQHKQECSSEQMFFKNNFPTFLDHDFL